LRIATSGDGVRAETSTNQQKKSYKIFLLNK